MNKNFTFFSVNFYKMIAVLFLSTSLIGLASYLGLKFIFSVIFTYFFYFIFNKIPRFIHINFGLILAITLFLTYFLYNKFLYKFCDFIGTVSLQKDHIELQVKGLPPVIFFQDILEVEYLNIPKSFKWRSLIIKTTTKIYRINESSFFLNLNHSHLSSPLYLLCLELQKELSFSNTKK